MPSDLEARILNPGRGRLGRGLAAAGIYLLIAVALLAELSLVALHPEDDGVLIVGVVLLTVAAAIWLPFVVLIPVVVAIWLIPPSVHAAVDAGSLTWTLAAALAGQLVLACATRLAYTALRFRLFQPSSALLPATSRDSAAQTLEPDRLIVREPPPEAARLPFGRVLDAHETKRLRDRLIGLDLELRQNDDAIRKTLEGCLRLELEYRSLARPRNAGPPLRPFLDSKPSPFEQAPAG